MKRTLHFLALLAAIVCGLGFQNSNNNYGGPAERLIGGPACLGAAGKTLGPITIQGVPTTQIIRGEIYIPGYNGADTLALQFNGDTGNNYRYWWLTAAPAGTTFAAGAVAATTDRIKLGQADTTQGRAIEVIIADRGAKTEKMVNILNVTGTGAVGTQANIDLGNGAWVSGAGVTINSITVMTSTNNMQAGTCAAFYGR
jgi:hypothetical protein